MTDREKSNTFYWHYWSLLVTGDGEYEGVLFWQAAKFVTFRHSLDDRKLQVFSNE
ncbi:MAG: hypothetical protein ACLTNP_06395 [Streptococcus salivarius]